MTAEQAEQILALADNDDTLRAALADWARYDDGEAGDAEFVAALATGVALYAAPIYFSAATVERIKCIVVNNPTEVT
jgi:hypothetical protein